MAARRDPSLPRGPLPKAEFDSIFSRVPRLTVEVVIATPEFGVLLALRDIPPCIGNWHLPGGTVRFGEPVIDAVRRVAFSELGLAVDVGDLLGYIEYPSHFNNGLDSPVGLAFRAMPEGAPPAASEIPADCRWFTTIPRMMHEEQKEFLAQHLGLARDD